MLRIYRKWIMLSEKKEISSLPDENTVFGSISNRISSELANLKFINNFELKKIVCSNYEDLSTDYDQFTDSGFYSNFKFISQNECSDLKRDEASKFSYQIENYVAYPQRGEKRKAIDEGTSSKKLETSTTYEKIDLTKGLAMDESKIYAEIKDNLLKVPISTKMQSNWNLICCYKDKMSSNNRDCKTLLINIILDISRISYLKPVAQENSVHLLQTSPFHEEIINDLTKELKCMSALAHKNSSDRLKCINDIMLLLCILKVLLEKFSQLCNAYFRREFSNESKYISYGKRNRILQLKDHNVEQIKKWKRRLENLKSTNFAQVLFMTCKNTELLNNFYR